jgi:hypothetical protein
MTCTLMSSFARQQTLPVAGVVDEPYMYSQLSQLRGVAGQARQST